MINRVMYNNEYPNELFITNAYNQNCDTNIMTISWVTIRFLGLTIKPLQIILNINYETILKRSEVSKKWSDTAKHQNSNNSRCNVFL